MRNAVPIVWSVAGDGAGGVLAFGFFDTMRSAQAFYDQTNLGGGGEVYPTQYWALLNRFNVTALYNYAAFTNGTNSPNVLPLARSLAASREFSVANPGTNVDTAWQFDDQDPIWVRNLQIAAKRRKM